MAYVQGDKITATSANDLFNVAKSVFGDSNSGATTYSSASFGYGQPGAPSTVLVGDKILATNWNALLTATINAAAFQGTAVSLPTSVSQGDVVAIIPNLVTALNAISAARLSFNPAGMSTATKNTTTRSTSWSTTISQTVTVTFGSWNQLRYFFNASGNIRFSGSLTSPGNGRSTAWQTMLSQIGLVSYGINGCTNSGSRGTGSSVGVYNLTTANQRIFNVTGSFYSTDEYRISARLNAAPGTATAIIFTVEFRYITAGDPIIGTISSVTSERRASNAYVQITTPTVSSTAIA